MELWAAWSASDALSVSARYSCEPWSARLGAQLIRFARKTSEVRAQGSPTLRLVTPVFFFPRHPAKPSTKDSTVRWSLAHLTPQTGASYRHCLRAVMRWHEHPLTSRIQDA